MKKDQQSGTDLRPYYTFGLPLLGLMGVIALAGLALAALVHFVF